MSSTTGSEDFSYFSKEISGFYFFLGVVPTETPKDRFEAFHSPKFYVDEKSIMIGKRSLAYLTFSYLNTNIE